MTWFDLLLKSDIDQNENHILGPSIVVIAKKLKAIIQKDELIIADLEGAGLERLKLQYQNDVELEYHVDQLKAASRTHYAARYYKQGIEDVISDRWSKETHRYIFDALNDVHHWQDSRINFFKAKISTRTEGNVYSDLRIKSVIHAVAKKKWGYGFLSSIVVKRFDDKEYKFSYADLLRPSLNDVEDMYLLQVQDKLYHLLLEFVKDFNNALLLFIRRVMIQNKVEDIQLGVEIYQKTLNLTKPMMFYEGIDHRIQFTMFRTHKGLSEVKKLCDGTLIKICENLVDMVKRNKLGTGNRQLKGRDWTNKDVEKSNEMVDKIVKVLKRREPLKRLEEYVGGRPKTVNPRTFVRPM
ncbi:hypothetical protein Tco_0951132 [Tanacetum coccineum]|uniref:Uncharacterized protein n=1 Tax=Tanacetum coccineum TaxID=301880 RepID=A0ABQ5DT91_9ASTR